MAALSLPRRILYAAVVTGVALILLLGGLELGLRLFGYGYSPHFFRRATLSGGETVWRENRWCTAPYFSPELVRRPQAVRLPGRKAAGTYRVFVLGSSAAMGDPDASFSLARVLEHMLRAAYPAQRFEVVNAAVTAINSHLVRGIAADCAALEPDLFIVYEGHNEVIGPFGPAGVFAPFLRNETAVRLAVWLKGLRVGQLLAATGRAATGNGGAPAGWGGMEMFLKQQVAVDDPRLDAVRARFRTNLQAIVAAGRRAGATTLLCTALTNQRDFAPFLSQHRPGLTAAELAQWENHLVAATRAQLAGDLPAAEAACRAAAAIDDRYADLAFRSGRLALQAGRDADARGLLQRALDLDTLRFRTDPALNQIVRALGQPGEAQLEVVDLAGTLAGRSAHGIVGDDLLYEHVHLTLRGTYEAARELFPRIAADLARRGLAAAAPAPAPVEYDEVRLRLGFNAHEQAMIAVELLNRFRRPPFAGQADSATRIQTWERRVKQGGDLLAQPEALPALRELARRARELAPDDWVLARNTGMMLVARGAPAEALPFLERANTWIDDDIDTIVALGRTFQALGRTGDAEAAFARARRLEANYPGLPAPATPVR